MVDPTAPELVLHASCVAVEGRALLVKGASGRGKSALCLEMMALGAVLVADDRVLLRRQGTRAVVAHPVGTVAGLIEARGIGILNADHCPSAAVHAVIDLDQATRDRIPPTRMISLLDIDIPLFYKPETPHLPASLKQLLKAGQSDR